MSDNFQKLLNKKTSFYDISDETTGTLTRLKQQNDSLQNNCDLELDASIIKIISTQKEQMLEIYIFLRKIYIDQTRENIQELEKIGKGLDQRNLVKKLKLVFVKEVDRNKQIMRRLISKSFASFGDQEQDSVDVDQRQIAQQISNFSIVDKAFPESSSRLSFSEAAYSKPHQVMDVKQLRQEYYTADFDNQLTRERQDDLDRLEEDALSLNVLMGQLAINVDQQDGQLDIIQDSQMKTQKNLVGATKELLIADQMSRQGKKKYIVLALLVVVITSALVSSLFYYDLIQL